MDLLEITATHQMKREDVAKLLREIADSLARHNSLEFVRDGIKLRVNVPVEVELELEVEIENDASSIEIEINW